MGSRESADIPAGHKRRRWHCRAGRWALYGLYCVVATYVLAEIVYSPLYVLEFIQRPRPDFCAYVIENTGGSSSFDPICGIRLSSTPCRHARITGGKLEYTGVIKGNNEGFPDRDDFGPERAVAGVPRIAIMGDSFTAAPYLEKSWPDAVEDAARGEGIPLELLNCSVNGGGITNWWSVVIRYLKAKDYQIDGLLFAVFDWDFDRGFFVADHQAFGRALCGYVGNNDPTTWPKTLEEARPYLSRDEGFLLSPKDYDRAIEGKWNPESNRPWKFYVASKIVSFAKKTFGMPKASAQAMMMPNPEFQSGVPEKIDEMAEYTKSQSIPVMVVRLPSREALVDKTPCPVIIQKFSDRIGATFVDGAGAFSGLTDDEVRANWLPVDGHWNQAGSDRFAAWFRPILVEWLEKNGHEATKPSVPSAGSGS